MHSVLRRPMLEKLQGINNLELLIINSLNELYTTESA